MEPRWEANGVFLELDPSDEAIVGTPTAIETTRSFRRMLADQQWNSETLRMFVGVLWNPRTLHFESLESICKRYITKSLVQEHGATDGCAACHGDSQYNVPRCRKRCEDIFDREKSPGQSLSEVQQELVQVEQEQRAMTQEPIERPPQPFSSHDDPMQVSTTPRRARIPDDENNTTTIRPRLDMSALICELSEYDVPEIDWEKFWREQ